MNGEPSYKPLVSVIIPNYNHAPFLKERIDSVLNQSYRHFEVILLDDGSTDNSREIIESYRGHVKIRHIEYNESNSGSTFKQWQKGLSLAKGEWIWIAESDDYASQDFLDCLISQITDEGMVYCRSNIVDKDNKPILLYNFKSMPDPEVYPDFRNSFSMEGIDFGNTYMQQLNSIPNASAVLFKKELIETVYFSEITQTKLFGDWLFWLYLLKKSKIRFVSDALNSFRFHANTVRNDTHFTATRLLEYRFIVSCHENYFGSNQKTIDTLLYNYTSGEVPLAKIKLTEHLKINSFLIKRAPLLLLKTYLKKVF
jgi:glycosyltransferase involved in cell wall biosynthesis